MLDFDYRDHLLIAILRGIQPDQAARVAETLFAVGFRIIEVPLNSPKPYESIKAISETLGSRALVGAGTVTEEEQVHRVKQAGGELVFSPSTNGAVIRASKQLDMVSMPGCCTPSEVFTALEHGADVIKFFPGSIVTPTALKDIKAVIPNVPVIAVGGVSETNMEDYIAAGANGFGLGSALYKPGRELAQIQQRAEMLYEAFKRARSSQR